MPAFHSVHILWVTYT